jgi:uncharacterized membrane-anchored protein
MRVARLRMLVARMENLLRKTIRLGVAMKNTSKLASAIVVAFLFLVSAVSTLAQPAPDPASNEAALEAEAKAAWQAGATAGTRGPAPIPLAEQAILELPADYLFIPKTEATRIMRATGNIVGEPSFLGLVVGTSPGDAWFVVARYIKEGYIKDDDAKEWNADDLLQQLKEGTEAGNRERAQRGFPELEIVGWVEKPTYDADDHRLVWSMLAKEKGESDADTRSINYNTYALGRDGYLSLNLVTSASRIDTDKLVARKLLAALSYNPGKRYEDFNSTTDRIAEYGLAALVGGVVAKKLGLFALIGVFLAKFAKVIAVAVLAFGGAVWRFFRRKPKVEQPDGSA